MFGWIVTALWDHGTVQFGILLRVRRPFVFVFFSNSTRMRKHEANSSLDCLDDRVDQPVLATPGGELGQDARIQHIGWRLLQTTTIWIRWPADTKTYCCRDFLVFSRLFHVFIFFDVCLSALNAAYATSTEDNIIYVWRHLRAPLHIMYTANSYKFHVCCFLLPKHVFRNFCTNSQKSTASLRHLSRWVCYCTCCIHAREGRPLTQLLGIVWQSKFVMQSTLITKFWNFFSVSDSSLSMLKKSWFVASWSWLFYTLWCDWCSLALALGYHRKFNLRLEFTNAVWNTVICVLHQNMAELDRTVNCCLANR
jgi:hypothetical protein